MNILLDGGKEGTIYFMKSLKADGHEVMIINSDYDLCQRVANEYEIPVVCGNCTSELILKEANAGKMDLVVALCENDADNLIICEIAKRIFNVKTTYSVVNNPQNINIFSALGVDKCMSPSMVLKQLVDQTGIEAGVEKYFNVRSKDYIVREIQVSKKSYCLNKKLWETGLPDSCNIISIFRDNEIIIPQGNTQLLLGDILLIATSLQVMDKVIEVLNVKKKETVIV